MSADIDIDFANRDAVTGLIRCIPARQRSDPPKKHASGVYVTDIPLDPMLGCAAIDHEEADRRGYFKIDLLNMGVYQMIRDQDHYQAMLAKAPPWSRLWENPAWTAQLVHVGGYTSLLRSMRPDTIPRMAAFISVIRPGKAHLQNRPWDEVFSTVWDQDNSQGYVFKKSHAVSYAVLVTLHMNLLDEITAPLS